jgi:hypothetical protein
MNRVLKFGKVNDFSLENKQKIDNFATGAWKFG